MPNQYGGNENLEAIAFLRKMNEVAYQAAPGVMTIAEESTSWPGVSQPTYNGGLGFGFKWNMGWMHDTLHYIQEDPVNRSYHHSQMTFGLLYAFSENFILPISHDEVVHGKGSLLDRMPGDEWQKFANLRAYLGWMFAHPGKKLLFMGCEFAQVKEWNHDVSLDWHLLDQPNHKGIQSLVRDLNHEYAATPALHERDCEAGGFKWLIGGDTENSVFAFARFGAHGDVAVAVSNFTPVPRTNYRVGVPKAGFFKETVNTDAGTYGGSNLGNMGGVHSEEIGAHGEGQSIVLDAAAAIDAHPHLRVGQAARSSRRSAASAASRAARPTRWVSSCVLSHSRRQAAASSSSCAAKDEPIAEPSGSRLSTIQHCRRVENHMSIVWTPSLPSIPTISTVLSACCAQADLARGPLRPSPWRRRRATLRPRSSRSRL